MPRRTDPDLSRAIGARLATMRKARGWSQERLAEASGLEPLSLSRAEAGARPLGLANLARVAKALEVPLGNLVDLDQPPAQPAQPPEELELVRQYRRLDDAGRKVLVGVVREIVRGWPRATGD